MLNDRLIHDASWAASVSIVELFRSVLRDDECNEAAQACYQRIRAAIEAMAILANRETMRLNPSRN